MKMKEIWKGFPNTKTEKSTVIVVVLFLGVLLLRITVGFY